MDQFDQPRRLEPARQRVRRYVEHFIALAREGSQGDDDENAPRIDVIDHVTLDVRDLRVLTEEPAASDLDQSERLAALEAVAETARSVRTVGSEQLLAVMPSAAGRLYAALDALDAPSTVGTSS